MVLVKLETYTLSLSLYEPREAKQGVTAGQIGKCYIGYMLIGNLIHPFAYEASLIHSGVFTKLSRI
jgi:hypothetical protein